MRFTLTQPFAPFIGTLPQLFVVNPAVVEANRGDDFGQSYLKGTAAGSGPFTQGRWEIGNLYEFKAVADYWAGWRNDSHLAGFMWIIQRDAATQKNSLLAGETHIADTIAGSDRDDVEDAAGKVVYINDGSMANTLKMNNQGKYTSDVNLRKAVAHAMNYAALPAMQDIPVTVLPGPTAANFIGYVEGLDIPTYDIDKAKEYLAKTPWPDAVSYTHLTLPTNREV
mgnify:CR=1 FL=1